LGNGFFVGGLRTVAVFSENARYGIFPPIAQTSDLEKFRTARQQNARADQQDQSGQAPDCAVDCVVHRRHRVKKPIHKFPPSMINDFRHHKIGNRSSAKTNRDGSSNTIRPKKTICLPCSDLCPFA
jgi:hypothetical protein